MITKICSGCKRELSNTNEYIYRCRTYADGLFTHSQNSKYFHGLIKRYDLDLVIWKWSYKTTVFRKWVGNVRQRPKKIDKNGCFLKFISGYSTVTRFLPLGSVDYWIRD